MVKILKTGIFLLFFGVLLDDFNFLHNSFSQDAFPEDIQEFPGPPIVYLVEDDLSLGNSIFRYLKDVLNLNVFYYENPMKCLHAINSNIGKENENELIPFCLITDISFSKSSTDGLLLIDLLREENYRFTSIVMTGFTSTENAIRATKENVFHYLTKPFELKILSDLVVKALSLEFGYSENFLYNKIVKESRNQVSYEASLSMGSIQSERLKEEYQFCGLVGRSPPMKKLFESIQKSSKSNLPVLISGPAGSDKELVGKAIHMLSLRKECQLVHLNCDSIFSELLESEIFGHYKGAFPGAITDRKGRLESVDGGSFFLSGIEKISLLLQSKLLKAFETNTTQRIGGGEQVLIDARIITSTEKNLEKEIKASNFRRDLFDKLNQISIQVPALKNRQEDIPLLISHFLNNFKSVDGEGGLEFDRGVLDILVNYDWPGNVRELENFIERLVVLRGGTLIREKDLPIKFFEKNFKRGTGQDFVIKIPGDGINLKKLFQILKTILLFKQ